jgi:hypothetical protein
MVITSLRGHGLFEKKMTNDNPILTLSFKANNFMSPTTFKARTRRHENKDLKVVPSRLHERYKSPHSRNNNETDMITYMTCMLVEVPVMTTLVKQ